MELISFGGNFQQQTTGLLRVLPFFVVTLLPAANYSVPQHESGYNRKYTIGSIQMLIISITGWLNLPQRNSNNYKLFKPLL